MTELTPDTTHEAILLATRKIFAIQGYEGVSMRLIAKEVGIAQSVLYYHFTNKEDLLKAVYQQSNYLLGQARAALPQLDTFEVLLKQRITFQFDHAEMVCAVLKYYLHFRTSFEKNPRGHLPEKTYLHIEEILIFAEQQHLYSFPDLEKEAKVIVHAINGFILEYFPSPIAKKEKNELVDTIADFILRALKPYKKGVV